MCAGLADALEPGTALVGVLQSETLSRGREENIGKRLAALNDSIIAADNALAKRSKQARVGPRLDIISVVSALKTYNCAAGYR